jgi:hypothetical protein
MDSHPAFKSAVFAVLTALLILLLVVLVFCCPAFAPQVSRLFS